MKDIGVSRAMIIIKTWANSWSTSDRYHEDHRFPCIFGCRSHVQCDPKAKDVLSHYLDCPILWSLVYSARGDPLNVVVSPLERACIWQPTRDSLERLVIAHQVYHALRLGYRELVVKAIKTKDFDALHVFACDLIHANIAEFPRHYA